MSWFKKATLGGGLGATKQEARGFRLAYAGRRTPRQPEVAEEGETHGC